ncbi:MAG: hypothetical protein JSR67_12945 [Proteobacteria bacterium]|nr:hypothetical protein [Pseudomonadota bacterium]
MFTKRRKTYKPPPPDTPAYVFLKNAGFVTATLFMLCVLVGWHRGQSLSETMGDSGALVVITGVAWTYALIAWSFYLAKQMELAPEMRSRYRSPSFKLLLWLLKAVKRNRAPAASD